MFRRRPAGLVDARLSSREALVSIAGNRGQAGECLVRVDQRASACVFGDRICRTKKYRVSARTDCSKHGAVEIRDAAMQNRRTRQKARPPTIPETLAGTGRTGEQFSDVRLCRTERVHAEYPTLHDRVMGSRCLVDAHKNRRRYCRNRADCRCREAAEARLLGSACGNDVDCARQPAHRGNESAAVPCCIKGARLCCHGWLPPDTRGSERSCCAVPANECSLSDKAGRYQRAASACTRLGAWLFVIECEFQLSPFTP